jgi:protein-disulfide isomerase
LNQRPRIISQSMPLLNLPSLLSPKRLCGSQSLNSVPKSLSPWLAGSLILCLTLISCTSTPANKNASTSPELKEQVLQIIRENPQVVVDSVQAYQQQQQQQIQQERQAFLQQMITSPSSVIGDSPKMGAADGKIVLLEFSDFQCPYCAQAHKIVKQFMDKHQDQVTFTYKHFPLTQIHAEAMPAAKASWAAQQQGKFWEYHDALFTQQQRLGEPLYLEIAKNLNLDVDRFNKDRQSPEAEAAVNKDVERAKSLGIPGTPFLTLNGETFAGEITLAELEQGLERVVQTNPAATPQPSPTEGQAQPSPETPAEGQ